MEQPDLKKHLVFNTTKIKDALVKLNTLGTDAILFVTDENNKLIGSLTDGDVRRALINNVSIENRVDEIIQNNPKFIIKENYSIDDVIHFRTNNFKIIPIVNAEKEIINILNFKIHNSYLPIDAILMAGGRGSRLAPMTDATPKPLLKIGDKAIMELNVDRLIKYGIDDFWFSVRYLGEQIEQYFSDGKCKNISIEYVFENEPLGTMGAVSKIKNLKHETVLITNSDILTNLDYEEFYLDFIKENADLSIVTIPYQVDIPYAVLETKDNKIINFAEKPTYTYYSNGGIYLIKKENLKLIPENTFFDATDLIEKLLKENKKVISYPFSNYWLDIGKPADFEKAQKDIHQIKF